MAKKGFFSWFKRDQKNDEQAQLEEAKRIESQQAEEAVERAEQARVEAERAEQAHAEAERAEQARVEAERAEQARVEAERAEQARVEAERAEQARVEAERAEQARVEAERAEQARVEAERVEQARVEAERVEQARVEAERAEQPAAAEVEANTEDKKLGFFQRLKQGLKRTSENLSDGFINIFAGKKIDDELFEELEEHLLMADVGVETTSKIIDSLIEQASRRQLKDAEALHELLKQELHRMVAKVDQPLVIENSDGPFVILMVGVNGVGKTTTIGKLAKQYQAQGKSVMLAAGDTFRAAAVEQLQVWGERNDIPVVAQHTGADSASVLFDAFEAAKARGVDVLIADTAGRLQNKAHLMEELKKVVRVMKKLDDSAPHEVMLALDAGTGQNAISQAQLFKEAVGLSGITITKLDGTAKGGVIFAIADKFGIPIRHLGVGEQIDDLRPFNADDFIDALFSKK
ncbi:signal recognition particle-docking protein FtsY [Paraferrimonas sp. SM1919]|uniref:signal recognition particle-docking protein FtsY n=1 Tax=Paraferrimonas sp. SM1919 TaxID=2662263 RepID=UPI0013D045DA|nr:signal recognition particle-docking protein FtsY [Paraferrimonas sp. SM1919]